MSLSPFFYNSSQFSSTHYAYAMLLPISFHSSARVEKLTFFLNENGAKKPVPSQQEKFCVRKIRDFKGIVHLVSKVVISLLFSIGYLFIFYYFNNLRSWITMLQAITYFLSYMGENHDFLLV